MRKGEWYMYVDEGGVFSLVRVDGFAPAPLGVKGMAVHYTTFIRVNAFAPEEQHAHIDYFTKYIPESTQIDAQVAEDLLTTLQRKLP